MSDKTTYPPSPTQDDHCPHFDERKFPGHVVVFASNCWYCGVDAERARLRAGVEALRGHAFNNDHERRLYDDVLALIDGEETRGGDDD